MSPHTDAPPVLPDLSGSGCRRCGGLDRYDTCDLPTDREIDAELARMARERAALGMPTLPKRETPPALGLFPMRSTA